MSSWIACPCGNHLHKNLFAGAKVCVVVEDGVLDAIDGRAAAGDAVHKIVLAGDLLIRCNSCGRIAIEDKKTGAISFYRKETPPEMPLNTPMLFAATTDAKRSRAFYEKVLGLKFVSDDQFALVFEVGGLSLRIQKVPSKPKLEYTVLGWMVKDIQAEVRRLTKAGVKFSHYEGMGQDPSGVWRSPSGAQIAWFSDPDGNTLSLTQPT